MYLPYLHAAERHIQTAPINHRGDTIAVLQDWELNQSYVTDLYCTRWA